jgi:hypothetical protein
MKIAIRTEALLETIEHRLAEISERQHALAVERTLLLEQLTPLRLGGTAPNIAVMQLKARGITLRGLTPRRALDRQGTGRILRAVRAPRASVVPLPIARPEPA